MPVRNLRGIGGIKPIPGHVWIPPSFAPIYKIEVFDGTNTTDITDFVIEGEYTDGVTRTIGDFIIRLDNSTQTYSSLFKLYNQVRIYLDYGSSATTLKFTGMIERLSTAGERLVITGRSSALRSTGKNVTYSATDTKRSDVLKAIIDKYFTGTITTNNVEEDTDLITVNYFDRPFWEVVEDLCGAGGRDAYIDSSFDFHYFVSGSRENTTEAAVHEYNLIVTGDFAPDLQSIANRIKVYGASTDGFPIVATADDEASQDLYDIKELKINDTSITTQDQAQARANFELANNKDPPTVGTVLSLMLPTIAPGEKTRISDPLNNLNPDYYQIQKFKHIFSNDDPPKTELTVQKERDTISQILKRRITFESETPVNVNPFEMDFSRIYDYSADSGTKTNTVISEGFLLTDGSSSGKWVSDQFDLSEDMTFAEIRSSGTALEGTKYWISTDGGLTFVELIPNEQKSVSGRNIKVRVDIESANTQINTVALYYKQ